MVQRRPRRAIAAVAAAVAVGARLGLAGVGGGCLPALAAIVAVAVALAASLRSFTRGKWSAATAVFVVCAAGVVSFANSRALSRSRMDSIEALRDLVEERHGAVVAGRVSSEPSIVKLPHGGARLRFDFTALAIPADPGDIRLEPTRMRVDWYGPTSMTGRKPPFPLPRAGEGWEIPGTLREVQLKSGVPFLVLSRRPKADSAERVPQLDDPAWKMRLWRLRTSGARALWNAMYGHFEHAALVSAMVLGTKGDLPPEAENVFKQSGTAHVLAISGLHVGVFCLALTWLCRLLGVSWRMSALPVVPCIVAYVFLTGAHASAVRAGTMFSLFIVGRSFSRRADPLASLFAAALLILVVWPDQVLDAGFRFSFLCTLALLLVPFKNMFAISAAAWFVSVPLTAAYFGQIVPVALLCNIAIVPLAMGVVWCAFAVLAVSAVFPAALAVVPGWICAKLAMLMESVARIGSGIPGAVLETRHWSMVASIAWYSGLVVLLLLLRRWKAARDAVKAEDETGESFDG